MTSDELPEMARELNRRGEAYALVTVVRAIAPTSAYVGAQAIVLADGTLHGWIGGGCAKEVVTMPRKTPSSAVSRSSCASATNESTPKRMWSTTRCPASNGSVGSSSNRIAAAALCVLGNTPADEARFLANRLQIRLTDTPLKRPSFWSRHKVRAMKTRRSRLRSPAKQVR